MRYLLSHPYIRLMRLDKPVGIWLLMWPNWWSATLAAGGVEWRVLALLALGSATMRSAGCIVNDIVDRSIDRKVERTRHRPLASGEVSLNEAAALLLSLLIASLAVAWLLGSLVVLLAAFWLLPVAMYPWMKRLTWWPQLFLGFTFNAGALFGWLSITGTLAWTAVLLHLGAIAWTLGYDAIYAHQDKHDDARVGVKSTALRLDEHSHYWLAGFYAFFVLCLFAVGLQHGLGAGYYLMLPLVALHLAWQLKTVNLDDRASCLHIFKSNQYTGALIFLACLLAAM